jgi:hypothetical protein
MSEERESTLGSRYRTRYYLLAGGKSKACLLVREKIGRMLREALHTT